MAATWSLRAPVPRDQPVGKGVTIMEGVIAPVDQEHVGQLLPNVGRKEQLASR